MVSLKAGQLHSRNKLTVSWYIHSVGDGLDYKVMMQLNPSCGIIVTLETDAYMECHELMVSNYFDKGSLEDHQIELDFLLLQYYVDIGEINWRSSVVEEAIG